MTTVECPDGPLTVGVQLQAGDDGPLTQQIFYPVVSRSAQRVRCAIEVPMPIRRKRGHCITCRYDLRHAEHEQCPKYDMTIPLRITIRS